MTKQEQIEEMRREIEKGFRKANCREPYTNKPYPYFETQKIEIAEALYNAGYRKIDVTNNVLDDAIDVSNNVLDDAIDVTFRGAVLRLAEKLWFVNKYRIMKQIESYTVDAIRIKSDKIMFEVHITECPDKCGLISGYSFGQDVFRTKEDAEKALEELKK